MYTYICAYVYMGVFAYVHVCLIYVCLSVYAAMCVQVCALSLQFGKEKLLRMCKIEIAFFLQDKIKYR